MNDLLYDLLIPLLLLAMAIVVAAAVRAKWVPWRANARLHSIGVTAHYGADWDGPRYQGVCSCGWRGRVAIMTDNGVLPTNTGEGYAIRAGFSHRHQMRALQPPTG